MTIAGMQARAAAAARALAALQPGNQLIVTHGNGPQIGLLAAECASGDAAAALPLDVLGAETEGQIGYLIEREFRSLLPPGTPIATLLTMVEIAPDDPALAEPTKFIGPILTEPAAKQFAAQHGWQFKRDGSAWRRVVASPRPQGILQVEPIRWLLDRQATVIAAGGGGIPVVRSADGSLTGIEAVIDKDLCSELLARELAADMLLLATDVAAVYVDWSTPAARALRRAAPHALRSYQFAAGSMGPKIEAACSFVERTGKPAIIGSLEDLAALIEGRAGTTVAVNSPMAFWEA
jgi:carbamate kinase